MYRFKLRKFSFMQETRIIFIFSLILTSILIFHTTQDLFGEIAEEVISKYECHYLKSGDALPPVEDLKYSPHLHSIFFHETSCGGKLTKRQACAIESAAKAHPKRHIYVLFSSPVTKETLRSRNLAALRLKQNIHFRRVHLEEYARGIVLRRLVSRKVVYESKWWIENSAHLLKILTLFKYGGIYLDTDVVIARPLTPLGNNWIGMQDSMNINTAVLAISKNKDGRKFIKSIMNELKTTYRPDVWIHNGPGAITRVLTKICKTRKAHEWSFSSCEGLEVYSPQYFYPVHYNQGKVYFEPGELSTVAKNAYGYHFWNKLTHNMKIQKDSPFMKMAEQYCPTIFQMYGDSFGDV